MLCSNLYDKYAFMCHNLSDLDSDSDSDLVIGDHTDNRCNKHYSIFSTLPAASGDVDSL